MEKYLETVSNQKEAIGYFISMVGINPGLETYMLKNKGIPMTFFFFFFFFFIGLCVPMACS